MNWKELSKNECKVIYETAIENGEILKSINDNDYVELKQMINRAFDLALSKVNGSKDNLDSIVNKYKFDCYFGKEVYSIFSDGKYRIGEREAANDDLWRFIQVRIIPELLYFRWKDNVVPRMFAQSNRLYLKTLWWYYNLSYNNSLDDTLNMLLKECNSTDTIVALVERCGSFGYRIDLYREIMKQKCQNDLGTSEFRDFMVLNSAKLKTINPYLSKDGLKGYVGELIKLSKGV